MIKKYHKTLFNIINESKTGNMKSQKSLDGHLGWKHTHSDRSVSGIIPTISYSATNIFLSNIRSSHVVALSGKAVFYQNTGGALNAIKNTSEKLIIVSLFYVIY